MMEKRLLITEDDDSLREIINDYFTSRGCAVQCAENGERAEELFQTGSFDAVLLDINLPDESGFAVCEKIRKTRESSCNPHGKYSERAYRYVRFGLFK